MRLLFKILKWIALGLAALVAAVVAVVFVAGQVTKMPGEAMTPSGLKQNSSFYVTARDGTRLAVDVWLPANYRAGERLPAVFYPTRYWRAIGWSWIARGAHGLGLFSPPDPLMDTEVFLKHGYAVVYMDVRGAGASEGSSLIPYAPDEIRDLGDVASWIARQNWSNGRIGVLGVSYSGHLAESAAHLGHPAIKAVAPLFAAYDAAEFIPGGVKIPGFVQDWSEFVEQLDSNDFCFQYGLQCRLTYGLAITGVKPVDGDRGGRHLAAIVKARRNTVIANAVANTAFADDPFGASRLNVEDRSVWHDKAGAGHIPFYVVNGWIEGFHGDGAFARYNSLANDQIVRVGALSHAGRHDTDPFAPVDRAAEPGIDKVWLEVIAFFDKTVKPEQPAPVGRLVRYSTLNAGTGYRETAVWPPQGLIAQKLYLGAAGRLTAAPASAQPVAYKVDFSSTTGKKNRWIGISTAGDVIYPDRRSEDKKLLVFTADPYAADTEITGTPVVRLAMSTTAKDTAVFAYLEDVAPDGRVTLVTEGMLRARDRKVSPAPYVADVPYHSLRRADAMAVNPGETMTMAFPLGVTSVVIRKGHSLRLALAGADASEFEQVPAKGPAPQWQVQLGRSEIDFAARPWH